MTTLDNYLSMAYKFAIKRGERDVKDVKIDFITAMNGDAFLKSEAQAKLKELTALQSSRGDGACFVSTIQRRFLEETVNG